MWTDATARGRLPKKTAARFPASVEDGGGQPLSNEAGLVRADPAARNWEETQTKLTRGDGDTIEAALWSQTRARNAARSGVAEGVSADGPTHGVRVVLTGHKTPPEVARIEYVWHIDTGAGSPIGRLTIARIDCDPITTLTMGVERRKPRTQRDPQRRRRTRRRRTRRPPPQTPRRIQGEQNRAGHVGGRC